jgi:hypothetical protein
LKDDRKGIAPLVLVLILAIILAVAGLGVYLLVLSPPPPGGTTASTTRTSSSSTTGGVAGMDYKGNFTYVQPLGPFGINDSSGKPVEWNSTQSASGTFSFTIDPATYIGSGTGHGSIIVTTQGYCTGSTTIPYSFNITAVHPPGSGFEIDFNPPSPPSVMVQLACQGSTNGFDMGNNPIAFLSVYPNGLSPTTIPVTSSQPPTDGISYSVIIVPAS